MKNLVPFLEILVAIAIPIIFIGLGVMISIMVIT